MVFSRLDCSLACSFSIIECNRIQQDFSKYPLRSSAPQPPEVPILFQHPEGAFRLNTSVDSQQDTLLAGDSLRCARRQEITL